MRDLQMAKKKKGRPITDEERQALLNASPEELPALAILFNRDVDILRAKKWYLEHKDRAHDHRNGYREERRKKGSSENTWTRWAKWEEDLVLHSTKSDIELSNELGRTVDSIVQKRLRLKKNAKKRKK